MDILFFVILPLATILIAIVLQRLLRSPILVAILVFAVYLILAFTVFTTEFLINAIIYALLAYITALIVKTICCLKRKIDLNCEHNENNLEEAIAGLEDNIEDLNNLLTRLLGTNTGCGCNRRLRR